MGQVPPSLGQVPPSLGQVPPSLGQVPSWDATPYSTPSTSVVPAAANYRPPLPTAATPAVSTKPLADDLAGDYVLISAEQLKAVEPWKIGEYKWVPYGALWADMIYATERTFPGAYTLYVPSPETEGEPAFTIDARRTRVGFNVTGPDVPLFGGASSGGQLELDFFGQYINENQAGVQIRHMYWEVKNEYWRMLVGQTWDVVSPLMPTTCSYSVGWMGGNIGYRRPQFRWDRYLDFSPTVLGILTLSLNHDIVPDFSTSSTTDRESDSWPVIESRVGWKLGDRGKDGRPLEFGVSGHLGRTQFDFRSTGPGPLYLPPADDRSFRSWSLNADLKAPLNEHCGFQGELFTGANVSPFLGGIGQGVSGYKRVPIRTCGGWVEFWYYLTPQLHSHTGYGVDDPNDRDLMVGRSFNSFLFTNLMYDITKKFTTGLELAYWKTSYVDQRAGLVPAGQLGPTEQGNSVIVNWMCKYAF